MIFGRKKTADPMPVIPDPPKPSLYKPTIPVRPIENITTCLYCSKTIIMVDGIEGWLHITNFKMLCYPDAGDVHSTATPRVLP